MSEVDVGTVVESRTLQSYSYTVPRRRISGFRSSQNLDKLRRALARAFTTRFASQCIYLGSMRQKQKQKEIVDSLLILGNGFDLAHGLETGWSNFQTYWLESIHSPQSPLISHVKRCSQCQQFSAPCAEGGRLIALENDDLVSRLYTEGLPEEGAFVQLCQIAMEVGRRAGSAKLLWSDFEDNLSRMLLPDIDDWGWDENSDDEWKYGAVLDQTGTDIRGIIDSKFTRWFKSLELDAEPNPKLRPMLDDHSRILNFNYTPTLAKAYGILDSVHIHGSLATDDLVYGHARNIRPEKWPTSTNALVGLETSTHLHLLRKQHNTGFIWERLRSAKHAGLHRIASYGFSYGFADKTYIALLVEEFCSKDTIWTQYFHDEADVEKARELLESTGFPGEIKHVRDTCFTV